MGAGSFNPTRFFAFFTIESNLYGAILFLFLAARRSASGSVGLDLARGASVVYLTVTFFVVIFLLSGADLQVAIPWVDAVLHKIFPVIVVLDWLVDPPAHRLTFRQGLTWLIFPLAWVAVHPGPRRRRRLVSLPVPQSGEWRIRGRRRNKRRDSHRLPDHRSGGRRAGQFRANLVVRAGLAVETREPEEADVVLGLAAHGEVGHDLADDAAELVAVTT